MEEKNDTKISLSTFFLIIAIIVIIIMAYFIYKFYNEKTIETEKVSNLNNQVSSLESTVNQLQGKIDTISNTIKTDNTDENTNIPLKTNEKEEKIKQFLTSGKIISTDSSVGAGNPEMYYFTSNGKFAYMNVPYFTKEGQTISSVGTWEIKDNNLILTIQQEKKVKGGKMVEATASDPYDYLENYTEEVLKSIYTKKYEIKDLIKDENKTYNTYYLKLDKMELFQLNLEEDDSIKELKNLSTSGIY